SSEIINKQDNKCQNVSNHHGFSLSDTFNIPMKNINRTKKMRNEVFLIEWKKKPAGISHLTVFPFKKAI
ncbi:hypothetical protein, partial [Bartonella sp. AC67GZZY]|uniref:hypothetical protein n=1 Tax=Bartonella sp. AC67GZZY TaxID=3243459 RepID=UPI0035CF5A35